MNVNMILANTGLYKRDLAKAMNISPQAMASRLQSKAIWSIDEVCAAADFFGIPITKLLDPSLTPAEALSIISERHDDEGGLPVADSISDGRLRGAWSLAA